MDTVYLGATLKLKEPKEQSHKTRPESYTTHPWEGGGGRSMYKDKDILAKKLEFA